MEKRILLVGEFSSFHFHLKQGLLEYGIDVTLASSGDGSRNFYRDIDIFPKSKGAYGIIMKQIYPFRLAKRLTGYNVVQFINPIIFTNKFGQNTYAINRIINTNEKSFLCATATDSVLWHFGKNKLIYNPLDDWKEYDLNKKRHYIEKKKALHWNIKMAEKVNGIIPSMFEYKVGYSNFKNIQKTIPIPVDINQFAYQGKSTSGKIKLFHGLSRPGFKGSRFIISAMKKVRDKYPNDVELMLPKKLNYDDYIKNIKDSNIVIDQANSLSWGYNAIISMALGKVVLSGAEPEALEEFGIENCPIINIRPNTNYIYEKLLYLLERKKLISNLGYKSRLFVEKFHSHIIIADKYLKAWSTK